MGRAGKTLSRAVICFRTDLQIGVCGTWLKGDDVYRSIMTFVISMCNIISATIDWQKDCLDLLWLLLTSYLSRVYTDVICVRICFIFFAMPTDGCGKESKSGRVRLVTLADTLRDNSCPTTTNGDTCNRIMADAGGASARCVCVYWGGVVVDHMGSFNTYRLPPLPRLPCFCPSLRTSHSITSLWHTQPQQAIQSLHSSQDRVGHSHSPLQRNALHCYPGHPHSFESIHY